MEAWLSRHGCQKLHRMSQTETTIRSERYRVYPEHPGPGSLRSRTSPPSGTSCTISRCRPHAGCEHLAGPTDAAQTLHKLTALLHAAAIHAPGASGSNHLQNCLKVLPWLAGIPATTLRPPTSFFSSFFSSVLDWTRPLQYLIVLSASSTLSLCCL